MLYRPATPSHNLRSRNESPNVPGVNACPTPESAPRERRARPPLPPPRSFAVERALFFAGGVAVWLGAVRAFLRWQRFPYHKHRRAAAALYAAPPLAFALLLLALDALLRRSEKEA